MAKRVNWRLFERDVQARRPDWGVTNHFFYLRPVGHILSGVSLDPGACGGYIWQYAMPLYVRSDFLHYGYGSRLEPPVGFIESGPVSEMAAKFVSNTEVLNDEISSLRGLEAFLNYLERSEIHRQRNTLTIALTCLLLCDEIGFNKYLNSTISKDENLLSRRDRESLKVIRSAMNLGIEEVRRTVLSWELDFKERFSIS